MLIEKLKKIRRIFLPHRIELWSEIINIDKSKTGLHIGPGLLG